MAMLPQLKNQRRLSPLTKLLIAAFTIGSITSGSSLQIKPDQTETFWQHEIAWNATANLAKATTSGGRMKGGGFGDDAPPETTPPESSNNQSSNNQSSDNSSADRSSYNHSSDDDSNRSSNPSNNNGMGFVEGVVILGVIGFAAYSAYLKSQSASGETGQQGTQPLQAQGLANPGPHKNAHSAPRPAVSRHLSGEITNNIVTVTQLQVAMMAQSRHVQRALNQIATDTDLSAPQGLTVGLRETVLTLLRSPDTWTHATATSKTVNTKQEAKEHFESLSIEERSKFDVESLSNVDGQVKQREIIQREDDIASYIVVTLIVGTAHDSPILDPVMSTDELKAALKRLGSITPEYLMVYEVMWSPQDETDSLTDDELLLNYPKMFQL